MVRTRNDLALGGFSAMNAAMITDLVALREYTERKAARLPALRSKIILKTPGIDQHEYARIKHALRHLPKTYGECIRQLNLHGISIGYFRLWPDVVRKANLVDSIVEINSTVKNPFLGFLRENGLYEVAAWEAEPICLASKQSSYTEGSTLKMSLVRPSPQLELLANSFEVFLLIAGNLDAIRSKYSKTGESAAAIAEFEDCVAHFAIPPEAVATWRAISEVVLSK
jgi:hypothetical protein